MRIAVASGKGGTGKTTVAVNLALSLWRSRPLLPIQLLDCDVEEPNAAIFLKPKVRQSWPVSIPVPEVDREKCDYCGRCAQVCAFNAIAVAKEVVLVFDQLCHGCGGCARFCPRGAIKEVERPIGVLEVGLVDQGAPVGSSKGGDPLELIQGRLNPGEAMAVPAIRAVKQQVKPDGVSILDAPPGTSCPVIETVRGADFCILVTEPTPFGFNDLVLAVEMLRRLAVPCGVVINRADLGDERVEHYCHEQDLPILMRIPWDQELARFYARGEAIVLHNRAWESQFVALYEKVVKQGGKGERAGSHKR
ncbi:MAG: ATP-binding protein [Clostridia bacterium]|nr:ATP-binding protein [Clostridia bacterium]